MSRTRIVGGVYTKITGGDYKMYTGGDTIITAAGKNDFANAENIIIGTDPEKAPLLVMNDPESINFLVHFKRIDNYDYSFGFDWMDDGYKYSCKNYEALKQEYVPAGENTLWEPKGKEYFTPWVCMRKGQKNVRLKIEIEVLNKDAIKDNDIIVLPQQNGISFSLDEINVNEIISKGFVEVEVCCDTVSEENRLFLVLDKWKNTVGKLNFFKNKTTYQLDVRFVEVKFKGKLKMEYDQHTIILNFSNNTSKVDFKDSELENKITSLELSKTIDRWKIYIKNNEAYFKKMFNQSLIEYLPIKDKRNHIAFEKILLDINDYTIGTQPINSDNEDIKKIKLCIEQIDIDSIVCDLDTLLDSLKRIYIRNFGNYSGVIVFIMPIIVRYPKKNENEKYQFYSAISDDVFKEGKNVLFANLNDLRKDILVHEVAHTLGLVHSFQSETIDKGRQVISKHIFNFRATENIMDYSNNTNSFWKWQWEEMQKDCYDLKFINN